MLSEMEELATRGDVSLFTLPVQALLKEILVVCALKYTFLFVTVLLFLKRSSWSSHFGRITK